MANNFEETKLYIIKEIDEKTKDFIEKSCGIMIETYEIEKCCENLRIISDHISLFYDGILNEKIEIQNNCKIRINELNNETEKMCKLMNLNFDSKLYNNLPLFSVENKLENDLEILREKLKQRNTEINELLLEQEILCKELGEIPQTLSDEDLFNETKIQLFHLYLEGLRNKKEKRLFEITSIRQDIKNDLDLLEISVDCQSHNKLIYDNNMSPTLENLTQLYELREIFNKQIVELYDSIDCLKVKLNSLWNFLDVSPSVKEKFSKMSKYSQTTYDKLLMEFNRCNKEKLENTEKFIEKLRNEITFWLNETLKSDQEKSKILNINNIYDAEDYVSFLEIELEKLKKFYNDNKNIFELVSERKILWERVIELDKKSLDPGRFNNRGGKLLKEERERKTITAKLLKIENTLKKLVNEYNKQQKEKFIIDGKDINEITFENWKENFIDSSKNSTKNTSNFKHITEIKHQSENGLSVFKQSSSLNHISCLRKNKRKCDFDNTEPISKRRAPNLLVVSNVESQKLHQKKLRNFDSNIAKRRRTRRIHNNPKINVTNGNDLTSDTTTYNLFQEHIAADPNYCSSITKERYQKKLKSPNKILYGHLSSPKYTFKNSRHLKISKSPVPGQSNSKLSTKGLTLLI